MDNTNFLENSIKGVSLQKIKRKFDRSFLMLLLVLVIVLGLLYFKAIQYKFSFLILVGGIVALVLYQGCLALRYKMIGVFGSSLQITGVAAVVVGIVYVIFSVVIMAVGLIIFFNF